MSGSLCEAPSVRAYKALREGGQSPYQKFKWPTPRRGVEGEWVTVKGFPSLCRWGLHGYLDVDDARAISEYVFEMEIAGNVVQDGQKVAGTRARLIRRVLPDESVCPAVLEFGERDCVECGQVHHCYKRGTGRSWACLIDGHAYQPESWESVARRLLAERAAS